MDVKRNEDKPLSHTPGPWTADDGEGYSQWTIWSGMLMVAKVVGDSAETDANAKLIAAAPELYAALSRLLTLPGLEGGVNDQAAITAAREALKKARGE